MKNVNTQASKKIKKSIRKKSNIRKKALTSKRFIPGKTRCRICRSRMTVTGTDTRVDEATGRVIITRNLKCLGKRAHKYPMTEIVK